MAQYQNIFYLNCAILITSMESRDVEKAFRAITSEC
jgi:hypothetical protein